MAGNRAIYEQVMDAGHSAAWDHEWNKAISAYARAIQEFPEDPSAHNSLGLALLEVGRLDDSLKVYNRSVQLDPDDPIPLEKSADVLERLGRLQEAAQRYVSVADIYLARRDLDKAIGNWERATRLTPGMLQIHYRLALAYERTGQKRSAVREYLTLAFNFQRANDKAKALQSAERAKRLEPTSPQVLNSIQAIQSDMLMVVPEVGDEPAAGAGAEASGAQAVPFPSHDIYSGQLPEGEPARDGGSHPGGPLGEAAEKALANLAEFVLNGDLSAATAHLIQAIEMQKIGENAQATEAFLDAEGSGVRHPGVFMCLGALYVYQGQWDNAQKYLGKVKDDPNYRAGVAHGMGCVYMGKAQPRAAAESLINALREVDNSLALAPGELNELAEVYDTLLESTKAVQDLDLNQMNTQFINWLTGSDWKVQIAETRRSLAERLATEGKGVIQDYVRNTETVEIVTRIDRYIKQGFLMLAMDEAFHAIEMEPTFLPIHQRIAKILMEEGRTQLAIMKYNIVANSFLAREDAPRAADVLHEAISIAPTDTSLRTSLIELLEHEQKWDQILDEYAKLADAYYQLADLEQARATYAEALRIAQKIEAPAQKRAEIMHHMADIDVSRLEVRQALRTYEQIRTLAPDDDKARRALVDLNYRLNNTVSAVKELDGLLRLFAQQKRGDQIISLLEQMVVQMPNDMALRSRMAAVYRQTNRREDAIAQLDALGELQLEAGLYQEACTTIKQIIALQPSDLEQYNNLLSQLGC